MPWDFQRVLWFRNVERYQTPKMGWSKSQKRTQAEWLQASADRVILWSKGESAGRTKDSHWRKDSFNKQKERVTQPRWGECYG